MSPTYYLLPRIFGLWSLFSNATGEKNLFWPGEGNSPVKDKDAIGFPLGSTMMFSGTPGSGQTVFSLALVRNLMGSLRENPILLTGNEKGTLSKNDIENSHLLYISTEPRFGDETSYERLSKGFANFGWFDGNDTIFTSDRVHVPDLSKSQFARPIRTPEDFINFISIKTTPYLNLIGNNMVFVIVDSISAILRDCKSPGERRGYAQEIVRILRDAFSKKSLALCILLSELNIPVEREIPAEEYVCDFVFRFRQRGVSEGHRLRTLEIVKARGASMEIGEHTWSILDKGQTSYKPIVSREVMRRIYNATNIEESPIKKVGLEDSGKVADIPPLNHATIAVFPHLGVLAEPPQNVEPPQDTGSSSPKKRDSTETFQKTISSSSEDQSKKIWTGTPGLDKMLNENAKDHPGISQGDCLFLFGPSGSGKTIMALQFLIGTEFDGKTGKRLNNQSENWKKSVFVSFEGTIDEIKSALPVESVDIFTHCRFLCQRRANLDLNLLVAEVAHTIREREAEFVVIDGLSALMSTIDSKMYSRFVELLVESIRNIRTPKNLPPTLFITFDTFSLFDRDSLNAVPQELPMLADHVVQLFEKATSDKETNTTLYEKRIRVLKSRGNNRRPEVHAFKKFESMTNEEHADISILWRPPMQVDTDPNSPKIVEN